MSEQAQSAGCFTNGARSLEERTCSLQMVQLTQETLRVQTHVCVTPQAGLDLSAVLFASDFRPPKSFYEKRRTRYRGGGGGAPLRIPFAESAAGSGNDLQPKHLHLQIHLRWRQEYHGHASPAMLTVTC